MKKDIKPDNELVTRGILRRALLPLKRADAKLREEMHEMEFRLTQKMDKQVELIDERMQKQTKIFQELADQIIGEHKKFEVESASIQYNYNQLEGRVKKVEEVVFE